jgi:hypothetical protein
VRFELTGPFEPSVFKTDAIGHSANLPVFYLSLSRTFFRYSRPTRPSSISRREVTIGPFFTDEDNLVLCPRLNSLTLADAISTKSYRLPTARTASSLVYRALDSDILTFVCCEIWSGYRESNSGSNLGKVTGYHYIIPALTWYIDTVSNRGPSPCKGDALPLSYRCVILFSHLGYCL